MFCGVNSATGAFRGEKRSRKVTGVGVPGTESTPGLLPGVPGRSLLAPGGCRALGLCAPADVLQCTRWVFSVQGKGSQFHPRTF